jgi:hypothetical protein
MTISPLVVLALVFLDQRRLRRIGSAGCAVGLVGLLTLLGWAVVTWEAWYGVMTGSTLGRRLIYLLATGTELPVVQVGVAGLILRVASWRVPATHAGTSRSDPARSSTFSVNGPED